MYFFNVNLECQHSLVTANGVDISSGAWAIVAGEAQRNALAAEA